MEYSSSVSGLRRRFEKWALTLLLVTGLFLGGVWLTFGNGPAAAADHGGTLSAKNAGRFVHSGRQVGGLGPQPLPVGAPVAPSVIDLGSGTGCIRLLMDNVLPDQLQVQVNYWVPAASPPGSVTYHQSSSYLLHSQLTGFYGLPVNTAVSMTFTRPEAVWLGAHQTPITVIYIPPTTVTTTQLVPQPQPPQPSRPIGKPALPPPAPVPPKRITVTENVSPSQAIPYDGCVATSVRLPGMADIMLQKPSSGTILFYGHDSANAGGRADTNDPSWATAVTNANIAARTYYATVDPPTVAGAITGNHDTLGQFWATAGFGADGSDGANGVSASYMNTTYFGQGQNAHMIQNPGNQWIYSYMTFFGLPNQDPANVGYAANRAPGQMGYTVAMEYNPNAPPSGGGTDLHVTFYVYDGGTATAHLVNSINLDGLGERFVPGACKVCHGEGYTYPPAKVGDPPDVRASFIPFDAGAFLYADGTRNLPAAMNGPLYNLNRLVYLAKPTDPFLQMLVGSATNPTHGWYPDFIKSPITGAYPAPNLSFAPDAWQGQETVYQQVVAKNCRSCHFSLHTDLSFNDFNTFSTWGIGSYVCASPIGSPSQSKEMPNNMFAFRNFWLSTAPTVTASATGMKTPCQ
jgi:hypothetical protein